MKKWYKSKTIWINFIIALLTVLEANYDFIKETSQDKYMYIVIITTAINFWLRTITTESIKRRKK
jgi:hypothetical protein